MADDHLQKTERLDGLKFVDGKTVECTWRTHQFPMADFKNPGLPVVRVFGAGSGLK